ncbi:MAG: metalloregulator ArsR/SmtB family transcription factor [Dehalococcoidia bacterium]|nr:metalloregulator ArsR/SmtB family transcription factor [Dehalococcoidia bacterium]
MTERVDTDSGELAEIFRRQAELCKSLADAKRLMILNALKDGPRSVSELAEVAGLKQSNASQHIGVLRRAGVIRPERRGNVVLYSLATPKIAAACDLVRQVIAEEIQRNEALVKIL